MLKPKRVERHRKMRVRLAGTQSRPRLAVYRSNAHIYAQIIDDTTHKTLVADSDFSVKSGSKKERAAQVGEAIAKKALGQKIEKVVFDTGGMKYHGRVAALADGARKGGLSF
jgi:large subunit ribosomal protein L18